MHAFSDYSQGGGERPEAIDSGQGKWVLLHAAPPIVQSYSIPRHPTMLPPFIYFVLFSLCSTGKAEMGALTSGCTPVRRMVSLTTAKISSSAGVSLKAPFLACMGFLDWWGMLVSGVWCVGLTASCTLLVPHKAPSDTQRPHIHSSLVSRGTGDRERCALCAEPGASLWPCKVHAVRKPSSLVRQGMRVPHANSHSMAKYGGP